MDGFLLERCIVGLAEDEGFRGKPYKDTVGKITIGFGRNLDDNPLTREEGEWLLRNDIISIMEDMRQFHWYTTLNSVRKYVVVNMVYNLGMDGFLGFKRMLAAIRKEEWQIAANEMMNSRWATQVGRRADRLAELMRDGE